MPKVPSLGGSTTVAGLSKRSNLMRERRIAFRAGDPLDELEHFRCNALGGNQRALHFPVPNVSGFRPRPMQPAEGFPYGRAVGGPDPRRPVAAVNAPAKGVLAPVFLEVRGGMGRIRTKIPGKFRSHRALPLIWAARRKAQGFGFLYEAHQDT